MKYKLCYDGRPWRNEVLGYPLDFQTDETDKQVGFVEIPDEAITKLHYAGPDRYEAGIVIRPIGKLNERIHFANNPQDKTIVKKVMEDLSRLNSTLDARILESFVNDAILINANIYLGISKSKEKEYCAIVIEKGESIDDALASKDAYLTREVSKTILAGEMCVPKRILGRMNRFSCDSANENVEHADPQITIPTKSLFNHYSYNLGRYDKPRKETALQK